MSQAQARRQGLASMDIADELPARYGSRFFTEGIPEARLPALSTALSTESDLPVPVFALELEEAPRGRNARFGGIP